MRFSYNYEKNLVNKKKHGISLQEAEKLWNSTHIIVPAKDIKGEQRYFIIGKIRNKVHVAILVQKKKSIRIISCHRADKKLERIYNEKIN
jgi:uncharacterized DUF497 family protein